MALNNLDICRGDRVADFYISVGFNLAGQIMATDIISTQNFALNYKYTSVFSYEYSITK